MTKKTGIYRGFWIDTLQFDSPQRFGYDWFCSALDHLFDAKLSKVDWEELEQFHRECLASPHLTDNQKVRLMCEAWGAFTGRGCVEPPLCKVNELNGVKK